MFKFCDFNKNEKVNCNSSKQTKGSSVLNIKLLKLFAIFVILFVSTSIVKNVFAYFTNYTNEITNNFTMIAEKDLTYNYHLLDNNSLLQDSHTESVRVGENIVLDSSKIINDEHYTFVKFKVGETDYSLDDVFVMPGHDAVIDEYYVGNYTITYVLNGGTNHENNPSGFTMLDTINLLSPEREHYVFKGWYEAEDFSGSKKDHYVIFYFSFIL